MKLENISKSFGSKLVLDRVSAEFTEGVTCLTGPSGCGKTTLLRVIAGLETADSGVLKDRPRRVSFMFQEDRLFPWLTALENIKIVCNDEERARALLKAVELEAEEKSLPATLSGGMKRRIALARALAFDCGLLILDEPFKGMDRALTERLAPLVRNAGVPVIVSTHSPDEQALLGGRVMRISKAGSSEHPQLLLLP